MLYTPAFFALFFANLMHVASYGAFFLFPLFITRHGGSSQDIGLIMGTFACASALSRPWVAQMIDRIGRKPSYAIGCGILTLMPLAHLFLHGALEHFYPPLLLIRIIHGIGLAICFTSVFTFIVDLIPVRRLNEGIGIFGTSGLIGLAVGPMIAEYVIKGYGFTVFFWTASALAAMALILQVPVKSRDHHLRGDSPDAPSFFALLLTRKQLVSGGLALLFGIGLAATGNFIAPFAEARSLGLISLYYLAYSCAAVSVRFVTGRLADRVGENQIIPWGLALAAAGLFMVPFVNADVFLLLVGFVFGIGHGLLFPALNAMAIRGEPYAIRGKVTGIFTGGIDTGAFLGAMILGRIGQSAGYNVLFVSAGILLLSGFFLFRLRPA